MLLVFIFYFAVNKTYIYITPEIQVKSKAANFIFREIKENETNVDESVVQIREISKLVYINNIF
ncbi:MAG: hypothetical protein P1U46_04730 [Patescibacteria group bacterium]|nr:hypothetical protein [Patescibacteria group bacterium]